MTAQGLFQHPAKEQEETMRWLNRMWSFFRGLVKRNKDEQELDEEVRSYAEMLGDEKTRQGMNEQQAQRAARMEMGGIEQVKEEVRSARVGVWLETLWQDVRFGARMLRKSPGFTAVAVLTLALGIGANTAIFSAVDGILLERLPYANLSRLVTIDGFKMFAAAGVEGTMSLSPDAWKEIQVKAPAFEQLGTYGRGEFALTGESEPEKLNGAEVSGDFFSILGVRPMLGRPILPADLEAGGGHVVVLSCGLWRGTFGSDPAILERRIVLNERPYTVIGVMPPEFDFGAGERGLWVPETERSEVYAIAELKRGVTVESANAQLKVVAAWFAGKNHKIFSNGWQFVARQLGRDTGDVGNSLWILLGAVGFVLLIACVNVGSLLMARAWVRRKEVAIREALGATRMRLFRQFLAESFLLAIAGGGLGLLLSVWGIPGLRAIAPPGTPRANLLKLDPSVLAFTAGVSILAGLLFGIAPALQSSARGEGAALLENLGRSMSGFSPRRSHWLQSAFVIVEVALTVILVVGATLAARSLKNILSLDLGFRTDHILSLSVHFSKAVCDPGDERKIAQCQLCIDNILDRIHSLPDVEAEAATSYIPLLGGNGALSLRTDGEPNEVGIEHGALLFFRPVTPSYFQAMGIPLLVGRGFGAEDSRDSHQVAIVNETFARRYFSGNPLGHRISHDKDRSGKPEWMEIVGEAQDSHDVDLLQEPVAEYYIPFAQAVPFPGGNFVVRTTDDRLAIASALKRQIWSVDKDAPIVDLKTMDQVVADKVAEPKFQALLLGAFGILGLVLAAVGIYGVISYSMTQRTHEIGIRVALGARPQDVLRMVVGQGMVLAGVGIAAGVAGALALTRFLRSSLFEIRPTDPATFSVVAALLALVSLAACYVPARRATKVDPMVALRYE